MDTTPAKKITSFISFILTELSNRLFAVIFLFLIFIFVVFLLVRSTQVASSQESQTVNAEIYEEYWFLLKRQSQEEILYQGLPGDVTKSRKVKEFIVKTGVKGKKPTPLPQILGRDYWLITKKMASDNPETAPYFLSLDVPFGDEEPFGPSPYLECNGQCNWEIPGEFGLHGIDGDLSRLSSKNLGSSGCVRHNDEDIRYLYQLLEPEKQPIRYYIEDV